MVKRRTDIPTRSVIFHRADTFYVIEIYPDEGPAEIAEHAALNPGTVKVSDAVTGETLWGGFQ